MLGLPDPSSTTLSRNVKIESRIVLVAANDSRLGSTSTRPAGTRRRRQQQQQQQHTIIQSLLWHHSAGIVLSFSSPSPSPAPATGASIHLPTTLPSPPPPPINNNGNNNNGGWSGGNDGGGHFNHYQANNEVMELAGNTPSAPQKAPSKSITLTLSSFAVTRKAYGKIVRLFTQEYKEATGRIVRFQLTFGGSGTQARAVIDGLPADIVSLALPLDVIKIEQAGLIEPGWQSKFTNKSIVTESVVSIVVRRGNPKGITGWQDLARDDIEVVVANPKTAGVARWIFLALWGHKMSAGESAAKVFVTKVFDNVEIMPRDAREASDVFYNQGFGDALLTYENEAVFTNLVVSPNNPLPYISPDNNVRITCPVATVDRNINVRPPEVRETAEAFLNFLFKPPAQREFIKYGFRTSNAIVKTELTAPNVKKVWEVEKRLGDWVKVQTTFFDEGGILTEIMNDVSKRKLEERIARARR